MPRPPYDHLDYLGASPAVDGLTLGAWAWWGLAPTLPPCCSDCVALHPLGRCGDVRNVSRTATGHEREG